MSRLSEIAKPSGIATDDDIAAVQAAINVLAEQGQLRKYLFLATAGQTTFSGQDSAGATLEYSTSFVDVFVNGVRLNNPDYVATDGQSIVLSQPVEEDDEVGIIAYGVAFPGSENQAVDVVYNNATSGLATPNVQGAIDEIVTTTADAVAKAHDQNTDTALALGTADEVTAAEVRATVDSVNNLIPTAQFSWDNNSTTTPVAKPQATPTADLIASIHDRMRGCLLLDDGTVNYYLNPTDWTQKADGTPSDLSGDDGMVMVEIPRFYVRNDSSGNTWLPLISAVPLAGFEVHPAFIKDGVEVPYRYYSAYDACVYDDSADAYIAGLNLNNSTGLVDASNDKLSSVSGVYPMVGLTRAEFRTLAENRGTGWRVGDWTLWSAIGLLLKVEAQTFDSQAVYGAGNTGNTYLGSSADQDDSPHTIAGAGNALGNGSTDATSGASNTDRPGTAFCKYRGIENFWGNCANWTDGVNLFSEGNTAGDKAFLYWNNDGATFADDTTTNYSPAIEIANTLSALRYATEFNQDFAWALLPTDFSATGSHGTTDFYFTNSGWQVPRVGNSADSGVRAGAFAFDGSEGSGSRRRNHGSRLAY